MGSCVCDHVESESTPGNDILPLWWAHAFPLTPSVSSWKSTQSSLWGLSPEAWARVPSPHLLQACELLLGWEVLFHNNISGECSQLCLQSTCLWTHHCSFLWGSEAPPWPCLWGGFLVCGNFSSFMTPSPDSGHHSEIFCLPLYLYLLPYFILRKLTCLFRSLQSFASVQNMFCRCCSACRWVFDVFVEGKFSLSYSYAILKVLSFYF